MADASQTTSRDRPPLIPVILEASAHPARGVVADMLVRRGDDAGAADGRAIAIVEMLLRMKMLRRDPPTYRELLEANHAG